MRVIPVRRRRTFAATTTVVVAAGVVIALVTTGSDDTSPTRPHPSPTASPIRSDVVAWAAIRYDGTPPAVPGTVAHRRRTPWCTAAQLSPLAPSFQGATGSAVGSVEVRNVGSAACALQGVPMLTGYGSQDRLVATPGPDDSFELHPWVVVRPHGIAAALVQIFGDESRCIGPVSRLVLDIGHGQPAFSATPTWVDGRGVQPRCGSDVPSRLRDTYDIAVGDWRYRSGGPRLPGADAVADIGGLPATVRQGGILHFRVTITGLPTSPCLPFREGLRGSYGATVTEQTFMLDCAAITALARSGTDPVVLDMQLAVPVSAPPGDVEPFWELPIGVSAVPTSGLTITAARP